MKRIAYNCGLVLSFIILINLFCTSESFGQMRYKAFFYGKATSGYGNIFDRFQIITTGPYGKQVTERNRESHGNGLNLNLAIGASISRSKNVSKYSYLDIFLLHRQLLASEAFYSLSGGGIQGRYQGYHANIVAGYAHTSIEVPNKRYEHNILGYGPVAPFAYGFGIGMNYPTGRRSPLILIWDVDMLFVRAPHDDLTGYLNYNWFSTSFGIKYYISGVR